MDLNYKLDQKKISGLALNLSESFALSFPHFWNKQPCSFFFGNVKLYLYIF